MNKKSAVIKQLYMQLPVALFNPSSKNKKKPILKIFLVFSQKKLIKTNKINKKKINKKLLRLTF